MLTLLIFTLVASLALASPHPPLHQRSGSTPQLMCETSGHSRICFDNGVYDCESQRTTSICAYCLPNPFNGKVHCMGEKAVPNAESTVSPEVKMPEAEAGTDIFPPMLHKRDATDAVEDALVSDSLLNSRHDEVLTLCDKRSNTTGQICLGSTIYSCTSHSVLHSCGGTNLCRELQPSDLTFVHSNPNPWCITEEEHNHFLLLRRSHIEDLGHDTHRFEAECAGNDSRHPMTSICIQTHLNDADANGGVNSTDPAQVYDCATREVTETCEELRNETLLDQDGQMGLCQQMYLPERVAKCISEVELEKQMGDLKEFVGVAGAFAKDSG